MHDRSRMWSLERTIAPLAVALVLPAGTLAAQWNVSMRAMQNPLGVGQCTAIEVVAMGIGGGVPVRPDGKQVSGFDFDLQLVSAAPDAFAWKDEGRRFLCAQAPTAPSAMVVASYPARHLKPAEIVPNVVLQQTVEVAMVVGAAVPPGPTATGGYPPVAGPYPAPTGTPGTGYPVPPTGPAAVPGANAYPQPDPAGYSTPGYPAPAGYPAPTSAPAPANSYPTPTAYPTAPVAQVPPTAPAAPTPDSGVRSGKQFLQRITGFAKRKAGDVATNTSTQVADATGEVIGNTMETGGQVVTSGVGAVTGAAGGQVRGVGKALGVVQQAKDPEDVAAAFAAGRAVLRGLRFTEGTAILEPSSGPLISQIAGALARTPGQFLIEAHVDGKHSPAAQALSEQRAAAVKAALVAAGSSPMQLAAVGYGATRPLPGAKGSARIEIARTQ